MSKELDAEIDAARERLISTANTPISMGNYRQIKRAFEEILLSITNIIDDLNEAIDKEEGDK